MRTWTDLSKMTDEQKKIHHWKRKKKWSQDHKERRSEIHRRPKSRFIGIVSKCKKIGREFSITLEQYCNFLSHPCFYCGYPLDETGVGLDRIDSAKGYTVRNSLPCCGYCNIAKNDNFTTDEMVKIIGPAIKLVKELRIANGKETST